MHSQGFYWRFAINGMRHNRQVYTPYLLTCTLMTAIFYIVFALSQNSGVGGTTAATLMMGTSIIAIFSIIFLFYTNNFLTKQRKREFGVYNVLGLEKRHIARILLRETLLSAVISIIAGLAAGMLLNKLAYLVLVRLTEADIALGFELHPQVFVVTVVMFLALFFLIFLNTLFQLRRSSAVQLLRCGSEGEKEPRSKWLLAIIGFLCLGGGYTISLLTKNVGMAVILFLVAVILVIIGTYCLFTAGSIVLLKMLRRNKSYYYRTNHFITVSGMMYRMKQNAAALATICILSTMVLVTVSSTLAMYIGCDDILHQRYPRMVNVEAIVDYSQPGDQALAEPAQAMIYELAEENNAEISNLLRSSFFETYAVCSRNVFDPDPLPDYEALGAGKLFVLTVADYQNMGGPAVSLAADEALLYGYNTGRFDYPEAQLCGITYRIAGQLDDLPNRAALGVSAYGYWCLIVSGEEQMTQLYSALGRDNTRRHYFLGFDVDDPDKGQAMINSFVPQWEALEAGLSQEAADSVTIIANSRDAERPGYFTLYGSLFFIGILLSATFIIATILIIYYKQISEGFQDQRRFAIMAQVGLSQTDVKRSIRSQVLTMFFLPLLSAGLHSAFAIPILYRILNALSVSDIKTVVLCTGGCFLVFALLYVGIYLMTARSYYRIVSQRQQ